MSAPTPSTSAAPSKREDDELSDIIPGTADLSADPSRAQTPSAATAAAAAADNDVKVDADGDVEMDAADGGADSPSKSQRQLEKQREREEQAAQREQARKQGAAKKAVQNENLNMTREQLKQSKLADSMKRFGYLLGQTELFQHFIDIKKERDPQFAALLAESEEQQQKKGKRKTKNGGADGGNRRRKTEKEEDEELLNEDDDTDQAFRFESSPSYVKGGTMRDYQVQGLNWMISLYHNGINGILADEMGLGKTLQTISFLGYLRDYCSTPGFHLVVVPKSTLDNWRREFDKWVPGFRVIVMQGAKEERTAVIQEKLLTQEFDVLITTYEMCLREASALKKLSWEYIVIDEAHRIKNVDSMLSQIVRQFNSRSRLLITGTPLQNNLMELWSLLNFLLPDVFSNSEDFESWFKGKGDENQDTVIQQLHKVLRPFLLRRVKADVEKSLLPKKEINIFVGLTEMQRKWYKSILEKDIDAVNGMVGGSGKKEGKTRLLNIVMQLRKCCNHPYLFDGAEPGPPFTTDEHLVFNSGKMVILDKLLKNMKEKGSRVLIFSQMSRVLDIMEDYCIFRDYKYCRIDGSSAHEDRIAAIDEYNKPGSEKFIFLLTTRAGGLGINLTTADIVVLFDSDWNPQADLQAMDRAHRIGQTKQVYVFRFVTDSSVEERILERAAQKLRLDQIVIQQGRAQQAAKGQQSKEDLVDMIQHGAEKIISSKDTMMIDNDIDEIIKQGEERTQEIQQKYQGLNLDDLNNFKSESALQWEGKDFKGQRIGSLWIEPSKRERKANYSVDSYYRDAMRVTTKPAAPKAPRAPKQITINEWQFLPRRLIELQERETAAHQRSIGYKVPSREPKDGETEEDVEAQRQQEQEVIDTAEGLTEDEEKEKEQLSTEGFQDWNRRDFQGFVRGCEKHGRDNFAGIAAEMADPNKTETDVRAYAKVFWERVSELSDSDRLVARIEEGESKLRKQHSNEQTLREFVSSFRSPLQQMKLPYTQNKGRSYSDDEDRFLLVQLAKYGLGRDDVYEQIKQDISRYPGFRFDWFIKSRTPIELHRRCATLLLLITKEDQAAAESGKVDGRTKASKKRKADAV
ncbi:chromatin remodeling complex Adenosinetriphosphatase [Tilletia horrida]|uniref:Chromatin remodeling complex Adenosinetriphosphatase n=1 Tax=Tilletia horrida TaxID=155126 RepID=A0AAN6GER3_9BASI|nr:chromatin remodeling complex Adenosinetriphosphatase [Tilletia horrida]KAK0532960.1 chromatin remodeling complex Adenosinetriphosphatase [Tilletia horrida]KAK0534774.1 chromatin remodeling complex Adenosinetriphosphatase [Tilletia horrida]KAK0551509.1 chromatin remodeling complex Adenosinetriphosphatase [Tilletia horrida]